MRWIFVVLGLILATITCHHPAQAQTVHLRQDLCYAAAPSGVSLPVAALGRLRFDCAAPPDAKAYRDGWLWLKLRHPDRLEAMPADWNLLLDQTRFSRVELVFVTRSGAVVRQTMTPGNIERHWVLGGSLRFDVSPPGRDIAQAYIGFERLPALSLMRKVRGISKDSTLRLEGWWLCLMGVFAGAILSAFSYNLLIYLGQRAAFQRWYLVWSCLVFAYGMVWTNMAAFALPWLIGPIAVRVQYVVLSLMIASGYMFFLSVVEGGLLPARLVRLGKGLAVLTVVSGLCSAFGPAAMVPLIDRTLNIVFLFGALCIASGVGIAMRRGSRVAWFYTIGWAPVLSAFALRMARNFGLTVQADAVDMWTFAAMAFECVALSLAIADRFRLLSDARERAESAREALEIERETYRRAAQTDYLTGLGNRAAHQAALKTLAARDSDAAFALMLIDVDHLKAANDRLGHDGGDFLLETIARVLVSAGGSTAMVARTGGDEFALLLPCPANGGSQIDSVVEALAARQGERLVHNGRAWALSYSIGLACFPQDGDSAERLAKNADLALYCAKSEGRGRLERYRPAMRTAMDQRTRFGEDAVHAIERGEFDLHFQPIVDLATGRAHCHEALLRWHHPTHGLLTPATFGEILEERKLGAAVQDHVLDLAIAALRDHPERIDRVCVNLIGQQLDGAPAARRLLARLQDNGIAPARFCIEVTEQIILDRALRRTVEALSVLHGAGIEVSLDDFGTGYASLIHLKMLPFDVLKIDRSFTLGLFQDDGQSEAIVRAITGLARGLGKAVVAEGIETERHLAAIAQMGCDFGQGFHFARPMPARLLPVNVRAA